MWTRGEGGQIFLKLCGRHKWMPPNCRLVIGWSLSHGYIVVKWLDRFHQIYLNFCLVVLIQFLVFITLLFLYNIPTTNPYFFCHITVRKCVYMTHARFSCIRCTTVFHTNWFWSFRAAIRTKRRRWNSRRHVIIQTWMAAATSVSIFSKTNGRHSTTSELSCCQYRVCLEVPFVEMTAYIVIFVLLVNF